MSSPLFVAFGNPLTDVTVEIEDSSLLKKYGIEEDSQTEVSSAIIDSLMIDVRSRLQDHPALRPGRCVCLVRGSRRALLAHVGAAGHFTLDFLVESQHLQKILDEASIVHVEGFFLSDRFPVCQYAVREIQRTRGKTLSYNLGSTYLFKEFGEESKFMAENADVVFGNRLEYAALGKIYDLEDGKECAVKLHSLSLSEEDASVKDRMGSYGKIVAMTDGKESVTVLWGRDSTRRETFNIEKLPSEKVADTTGAGDAFLAGFIWCLMNNQKIEVCAKFACRMAAFFISYVGLQPPPELRFPSIEEFVCENSL